MDHIQQLFEKWELPQQELQALINYEWRDNFQLIPLAVFDELVQYRDEFGLPDTVFPLIECGGSNYIGIHISGPLKNKICFIDHEEMDVSPVFRNVQQLLSAITAAPECYDYRDIPEDSFDYPSLPGLPEPWLSADRAAVAVLREQYSTDTENIQLAFHIMALTPYDDIAQLIPWLNNKDMYIQERAIRTFGWHRYLPVKQQLEELTVKAQHNGKLAARIALERFNSTAP
jgi:hypothetical protein